MGIYIKKSILISVIILLLLPILADSGDVDAGFLFEIKTPENNSIITTDSFKLNSLIDVDGNCQFSLDGSEYSDFSSVETITDPLVIDSAPMWTGTNELVMWNNFASSKQVLTATDLPDVLTSGNYVDQANVSVPYFQYLTFTNAAANGQIVYDTRSGGTAPELGLKFTGSNTVYTYLLPFHPSPVLQAVIPPGNAINMINTQLSMFGKEWTITEATTSGSNDLSLTLISGLDKIELQDTNMMDSNFYAGVKLNGVFLTDVIVSMTGTASSSYLTLYQIQIRWTPSLERFVTTENSLRDPLSGAWKIFFGGIIPAIDDSASRETITVTPSGTAGTLQLVTADGHSLAQNFVKATGATTVALQDAGGYALHLVENATVAENEYVVLGQNLLAGSGQNPFGHVIRVLSLETSSSVTSTFQDVASGATLTVTGGDTTMYLDGQAYYINVLNTTHCTITWGTMAADGDVGSAIDVYPAIMTSKGGWVAITAPIVITGLSPGVEYTLNFPTGDLQFTPDILGFSSGTYTIGQAKYEIECSLGGNSITIYSTDNWAPLAWTTPGVLFVENSDETNNRNLIAVRMGPDGTFTRVIVAASPSFTGYVTQNPTVSGSTQNRYMDSYGSYVTYDSTAPGLFTLSYPEEQVEAEVYVETYYTTNRNFTETVTGLDDGDHEINVKCNYFDTNLNKSVFFYVNVQPPIITITSPDSVVTQTSESYFEFGGYKLIWFNVTTNEEAWCKYSDTDVDFDLMSNDLWSGGTIPSPYATYSIHHFDYLFNHSDGIYTYYVRCRDWYENTNQESERVSFIVNMHLTAPNIISVNTDAYQTSTDVTLNINTDKDAYCRYSDEGIGYDYMTYQFDSGEGTTHHLTDVETDEGINIFYASCSDTEDASMLTATPIIFNVDTSGLYNITIDLKQWWNSFFLPRIILETIDSLGGDYIIDNVLESIAGLYEIIYYHDGDSWTSYAPGRPVNDLTEFNDQLNKPFWIKMYEAGRIEIQ